LIIRTYGPFSVDDDVKLAACASRMENQDAIDTCAVGSVLVSAQARIQPCGIHLTVEFTVLDIEPSGMAKGGSTEG